ncbi:head maturation protease, ClpP-related [Enterococcus sp. AZ007]|uniref:head maturation protease, ClpP-related n=1 Tax=Enterococcus sp. AZ007 TaxID=2774839 RepID=UPI003F28AA7E
MIKLRMSGVVGYDITADDVSKFLNENDDQDLTIFLNSPGGYVVDGLEIYNLLRASGRNITTVLTGMAASMGSILFLAGDTRIAMSGTLFMIHKPSGIAWGDADDFRKEAELLDKMQGSLQEIYEDRAQIENLEELINEEKWFNVEEMTNNGIVNSDEPVSFDVVIETDDNDEGLTSLESEDAMAKIDDLKAEKERLEAEKAELEEKVEEARLETELATMKADIDKLRAEADPKPETVKEVDEEAETVDEDGEITAEAEPDYETEDVVEPQEEEVTEIEEETAVIDTKKTVAMKSNNKIPAFMQAESKY